jgi:hypothetical protein
VDDPRGLSVVAAELVRSQPDLIVGGGTEAMLQAVLGPISMREAQPLPRVPQRNGNGSGYCRRDQWFRPWRPKVRRMREDIANQSHDRTERCLAADAVSGPLHLDEKYNGNHRTNSPANCGEDYMLKTERRKNVAACHHEKASEPRACELFGSRSGEAARTQSIERELAQVQRCHPYRPRSL